MKKTVILGLLFVSKDTFYYGGEMGIRTPETALTVYTISNRAPSANSDTSPDSITLIIVQQSISKIKYNYKNKSEILL